MNKKINDPAVRELAGHAAMIRDDYPPDASDWAGSPFEWIRAVPSSRRKGAIAEKLVSAWLAGKGFSVARTGDSEADRLIETSRVEIKPSTLWEGGKYKFQQLRDQRYDFVICLGLSPFDAHCWVIEKSEVLRRWADRDGIVSQHAGARGRDTAWVEVNVNDPPEWLDACGGSLSAGLVRITLFTGYQPQ